MWESRGRRIGDPMASSEEARKLRICLNRPDHHPSVAWRWSLESDLSSKVSRVVRGRVVGKVPRWATRWRPTLRHVRLQREAWRNGPSGTALCADPLQFYPWIHTVCEVRKRLIGFRAIMARLLKPIWAWCSCCIAEMSYRRCGTIIDCSQTA